MDRVFFKKISNSLIWNQLRYFLLYPLIILFSVVLARGLEPAEYGKYIGIIALNQVFMLISSLGLEGVNLIYLPKIKDSGNRSNISYYIKRLLLIRGAATAVTAVIFLLVSEYALNYLDIKGDTWTLTLLIISFFFLANINSLLSSFCKGLLRFKTIFAADIMEYTLNIALSFTLLIYVRDVTVIVFVIMLSQLAAIFIYIMELKPYLTSAGSRIDFSLINSLGLNLYGTRYLNYALSKQKEIILIGYFFNNPVMLALFNIAARLSESINSLLTIGFGEVTQPLFSELYKKQGIENLKGLWSLFLKLEMLLTIPLILFAIINSKFIIIFFYSEKYIQAIPAFQILCILMLISGGFIGSGTSQKVLYAIDKQKEVFKITLAAGTAGICLSLLLIPVYGITGAVFAAGLPVILWRFLELTCFIRITKAPYPFSYLLKLLFSGLTAGYFSHLVNINGIIAFSLSAMIYFAVIILMLIVLKPFKSRDKIELLLPSSRLARYYKLFS